MSDVSRKSKILKSGFFFFYNFNNCVRNIIIIIIFRTGNIIIAPSKGDEKNRPNKWKSGGRRVCPPHLSPPQSTVGQSNSQTSPRQSVFKSIADCPKINLVSIPEQTRHFLRPDPNFHRSVFDFSFAVRNKEMCSRRLSYRSENCAILFSVSRATLDNIIVSAPIRRPPYRAVYRRKRNNITCVYQGITTTVLCYRTP